MLDILDGAAAEVVDLGACPSAPELDVLPSTGVATVPFGLWGASAASPDGTLSLALLSLAPLMDART